MNCGLTTESKQTTSQKLSTIARKQTKLQNLINECDKISEMNDEETKEEIVRKIHDVQENFIEYLEGMISKEEVKEDAVQLRKILREVNMEKRRVNCRTNKFQKKKRKKIPMLPKWALEYEIQELRIGNVRLKNRVERLERFVKRENS